MSSLYIYISIALSAGPFPPFTRASASPGASVLRAAVSAVSAVSVPTGTLVGGVGQAGQGRAEGGWRVAEVVARTVLRRMVLVRLVNKQVLHVCL